MSLKVRKRFSMGYLFKSAFSEINLNLCKFKTNNIHILDLH